MKRNVFVSLLIVVLLFTGFGGQVAGADDPPAHPYLYFTQEDLTYLRALQTAPSHQAIWNNIVSWADAHLTDVPPAEPTNPGLGTAQTIRRHIETMGFMYAMTEDAVYADAAKDWMLSVSGWSSWDSNPNHGQATSAMSVGMAFGYDVLYSYLSPSERDTILQAMVTHITPMYNTRLSYPDYGEHYANTISTTAGAIGLAALALGEDYAGSSDWLNFAISEAQRVLIDYGGQDGGWYEGLFYGHYAMDEFVPFLDALKRVTGQDLFAGNDFLENHAYYYIYLTYNGNPLQFEDCNWHEGWVLSYLPFMYKLASEYNNGYAQWFADNYAEQSMMQSYIWKNPGVVAVSPTNLPLTRHFDDTGYVIARSGWGSNDLLFAFKSGSSQGHAHNSQNEFGIYYNGKPITSGPGYVCMQPTDDTWTHNSILIDGLGQCQEPGDYGSCPLGTRGQILSVEESDGNYVYMLGDASDVYTGWSGTSMGRTYTVGDLDLWHRHVVFVRNPNYFVIFDRLRAPSEKRFDMVFNLPKLRWNAPVPSISVNGELVTLSQTYGAGAQIQAIVVEPQGFTHEIIEYLEYGTDPGTRAKQIRMSTPTLGTTAEFLTVLYPDSVLPVEEVKVGNLLGVIISDNSNKDLVLFSSDGNPVDQYVELGGYYRAIDGGSYTFDGTRVRAQFDTYQVMRLEELTGTNHAPVLDHVGNKAVDEGQLLEFAISATDPDGDNLTYSAANLPEGASFDTATQTFSWTPASGQAGTYPDVHFEVTDGSLTDAEDITITVSSAEVTPPVISFIPPTDADDAVVDRDWTEVNVSVNSTLDTSSFIDWNRSLVGFWSFNENSGSVANDKSTYGNNGALINGPQWTSGKFGNALKFLNDDNYLLIEDSESMDFDKSEGTIEMWVYPFDKASGAFQRLVMDSNWDFGNSPGGIELAIQPGGNLYFYPAKGGSDNYNLVTDPLNNNEWQHLTVTWNYSTKKVLIYINGVSQSLAEENVPDNWDSVAQTGDWHIGGTNLDITGKFFNGLIDEVRIWNRALSSEEIEAAYNSKINNLSHRFTDLADGSYQYYAYTTDINGNSAQTETRTLTIETTPGGHLPGDANEDGSVNSMDITKVERIMMTLDAPTSSADANDDGDINALDITQIELIIMNG